jgi:propanediol dehydratase small subunit
MHPLKGSFSRKIGKTHPFWVRNASTKIIDDIILTAIVDGCQPAV